MNNDIKNKDNDVKKIVPILLDSKHIIDTFYSKSLYKDYNLKLIQCGDYFQLYLYENKKTKKILNEPINDLDLRKVNKSNKKTKQDKVKKIEERSIIRSKLSCQRIAKANMNVWKSFITLTFKDNLKDINTADKRLKYFLTKIRRVKKDFKYLGIREFQKRGAIHYHILTNIACDSFIIPKREKKHLYNPNTKQYKDLEYYDIKYWLDGFSSAEPITDDAKKIVGYISKYMTKDIDQRLFGYRRYFYSKNLIMPITSYINTTSEKDVDFFTKKIQDKNLIYQNAYYDKFDNKISFLELK